MIYDKDANMDALDGKLIAIIGYGNQGDAQANMLRDSGIEVIVGLRKGSKNWHKAKKDGFKVMDIKQAAKKADIIHILIPDEAQSEVYESKIKKQMKKGKTLCFSHGFNICFKQILPPKGVDVIMISPNSPGTEARAAYLNSKGVPALISIKQDYSKKARETALAMAKAMHFTKAGVTECTFEQETFSDLFAEQTVLCGGLVNLMKNAFEVLVEAGYPEEIAYNCCVYEVKLIIDLILKKGFKGMSEAISNTAEYGMWSVGDKIINVNVKKEMERALSRIEDGSFAKEWTKEYKKGMTFLKKNQEKISKHKIESAWKKMRKSSKG